MPSTTIDVRKRWSDEDEVAIIDAVHASLVAAFRIPENDKHVRFIEHLPHRLAHPPSLTQPELMTLLTIDCFEGRSVDAKRDLYRNIVERLEEFGTRVTTSRSRCATCRERTGAFEAGRQRATLTSDSTSESDAA